MEPLYGRSGAGARNGRTHSVSEPKRRRLFRLPFHHTAPREDADDEIQFHLDMKTEKLRAMGFSDLEARAEAFTYGMFAQVLEVEPAIGRGFTSEDDSPSGNVVLLSDGFWKRGFGGDPSIVGREIILDDRPQTVIGVMPASFRPPGFLGTDIWTPLGIDPTTDPPRGDASFRSVGRMVDAESLGLARTQADALATRLEEAGEGGRSGPNRRTSRARSVLVVGQIGLTLVLLVASGLLVRSFENLKAVDLGFDAENVLSMQIFMSSTRYPDAVARRAFMADIESRLAGIPGVEGVGSVNSLPLASFDGDTQFTIEGEPRPEPGEQIVWLRRATVGYLDAMRIPVVAGRAFDDNDTDEQTQVIIINETLADRYFGSASDALGQRLNVNSPERAVWRPVVGVVRDIKNFGLRAGSRNAMYIPFNQISTAFMFTVVRTVGDPLTVASAVRQEVSEVDATIAVAQLQPMEDLVFDALATDRFSTALLTGFAMVALLLAVVGLYGVVSYGVSTRLREMGVRIALGAESSSIRGLVMRWALGMALMGIALGAAGAYGVTRLMQDLLFGVEAADPLTFATTAVIMAGAAVLASLIPALRATRIDPIKVLKAE